MSDFLGNRDAWLELALNLSGGMRQYDADDRILGPAFAGVYVLDSPGNRLCEQGRLGSAAMDGTYIVLNGAWLPDRLSQLVIGLHERAHIYHRAYSASDPESERICEAHVIQVLGQVLDRKTAADLYTAVLQRRLATWPGLDAALLALMNGSHQALQEAAAFCYLQVHQLEKRAPKVKAVRAPAAPSARRLETGQKAKPKPQPKPMQIRIRDVCGGVIGCVVEVWAPV